MVGTVDSHVHIFPNMGGPSGFESVERHMQFATQIMFHRSEGRRLHDNAPVVGREWHKGEDIYQVNLRGGDFGRFLWTADGVDYARYYLPPTARDLDSPPEQIIAQMDYVGVERGVVQAGHVYGRLNDYLARVAEEYPDRLWALATVEEWNADDPSQIAEIERAVRDLGLRGLFFDSGLIGKFGRTTLPGDPIFDPFWETVRRLDIPVFWNITSQGAGVEAWLEQQRSFGSWLTRFPDIKCVYTHGLPLYRFVDDSGGIAIPEEAWAPLEADNVYTEILVPISDGRCVGVPVRRVAAVHPRLLRAHRPGPARLGFRYPERRTPLHIRTVARLPGASLRLHPAGPHEADHQRKHPVLIRRLTVRRDLCKSPSPRGSGLG